MSDRRLALIVASSTFEDPDLRKLTAPPRDAEELAGVLGDTRFGDFVVLPPLLNRSHGEVIQAIEVFFTGDDCLARDLRLLYFSGHGIKNDDGRLYLATSDTKRARLRSTALDSRFVHEVMQASPCRQQVLLLDACYSGAMGDAMLAKGDSSVGIKETFRARGRCVLAASDAMQQAFEGKSVVGEAQPSVFTRVLLDGIRSGDADLDHDGRITFNELSSFVEERVRELQPGQTPMKFALEEQGELLLARAPSAIELEFGGQPKRTIDRLAELRAGLDNAIPPKRMGLQKNCLLCTWNIRAMGSLTTKWESTNEDTPKRDLTDVYCIAEIISRFDVVVISEVRDDMQALRYVKKALGQDWSFTMTDTSDAAAGNLERRALLFDARRVHPSGLATEITPRHVPGINEAFMAQAFADRPYAMTFESDVGSFTLVIIHPVLAGNSNTQPHQALKAFFEWLAEWATQEQRWGNDLIVLGDFNIDRRGDPVIEIASASGLTPVGNLHDLPRTIFHHASPGSFHDQFAYFTTTEGPLLAAELKSAGSFDFIGSQIHWSESAVELSWRISDHLPLWAEFS